jgi:Ni/Co efflux regulator RcnB
MKMHLLATAALLLWPDIASAQQQQQTRPGPERPGATRPAPSGPQRPDRPGRPGGPNHGGGNVRPPTPGRPEIQPPRPVRPQPPVRPRPPERPGNGHRPPPSYRPGTGRPPHFKPVHGPVFRYPRGYAYRRWTIGLLLPRLFLSSGYYYDNYPALGIGAPPPGARWVRYGPDLLLVDVRTGRIRDVIYGAFL